MNLEKRVENLELIVKGLTKDLKDLKEELNQEIYNDNRWRNNIVDDYMIKLMFPNLYCDINNLIAGFPKNRGKVAKNLYPGQYMFIYLTSPIKKIIGLAEVVSTVKEDLNNDRWPYYVDLEWIIKPRAGLTFSECGLDIRPRPGDTLYSITNNKAKEIIDKLKQQDELDNSTLKFLANQYK